MECRDKEKSLAGEPVDFLLMSLIYDTRFWYRDLRSSLAPGKSLNFGANFIQPRFSVA